MAVPTVEQLSKINRLTLVPLTEDQTHVFQAKIIGTKRIEKYRMKITPNFLRKMADQVKEGIALLVDHPWMNFGTLSFPYGRTFDSRIVEESGELELYGDHYMVKGQEANGISTDQLASGIDGGTLFDTSAGFITTKHTCSICGGNYFRGSECSHLRGQLYDGKECLVLADDGYIMENSIVFDGGYEGAGFKRSSLSASSQGTDNETPVKYEPLSLDAKSLSGDERVFYFFSKKDGLSAFVLKQSENNNENNEKAMNLAGGDETMGDTQKELELNLQQTKAALDTATGILNKVRLALSAEGDSEILGKLTALTAQAEDGKAYKLKLVDETCGAGVRALGEAFNVEAMKLSFEALSATQVEKIRDSYDAQAKALFGGGGRHTEGDDINLPAGALNGTAPSNPNNKPTEKTPEELRALARDEARAALKSTGHSNLLKEDK
jgi:hypothetical protein